MVRKLLWTLLLAMLLLPVCASADVIDDADVFTDMEEAALADHIAIIEELYPSDVVVLTSYDTPEDTSARLVDVGNWANAYFIQHGYGEGELKTGVLLLIDMKNHAVYLAPRGAMAGLIYDEKLDRVLDAAMDDLEAGRLCDGTQAMLGELLWLVCEETGNAVPVEVPETGSMPEESGMTAESSAPFAVMMSLAPVLSILMLMMGGVVQ